MKKPPQGAARTRTRRPRALRNDDECGEIGAAAHRGHIQPAGGRTVNFGGRMGNRRSTSAGLPRPGASCGQTCELTVDEPRFLVRKQKVRGITLGIQKYRLTWGFTSAKVSDVPDSACRPGLRHRVCRTKPQGGGRRKTGSVHEVEAGSGGAIRHTATPDRALDLSGATEEWSGAEAPEVTPTDFRSGGSHDAETEGTGLPGSA